MLPAPPIVDVQIHCTGLTDQDLRDLSFFGVEAAVSVAGDDAPEADAASLMEYFEARVREDPPRLRAAGLAPFVALGVHPHRVPDRGLPELLARLPAILGQPRVVAVGAIGLEEGTPLEEEAFARQLELAQGVRRPVIVHTPEKDKPRITRRVLAMIRESGMEPGQVLVTKVDARTVRLVRECGHHAGLVVHPARITAEEAVAVIRKLGSGEIVLASDAGRSGPGDLLALPRTAMLLEKAGLSTEINRRVCRENALSFFGIDEAMLRP